MYWIYGIKIMGQLRYIGITKDLERRQKEHNHLCFVKKWKKKILYKEILLTDIKFIKLHIIKKMPNKLEARRYECLLILKDHFGGKKLWQKVPRISDL